MAGYVGGEPGSTLIAAMREVAFGPFVGGTTGPRATTRARVVAGALELTTPGYHLTLKPAGAARQVHEAPQSGPAAGQCPG